MRTVLASAVVALLLTASAYQPAAFIGAAGREDAAPRAGSATSDEDALAQILTGPRGRESRWTERPDLVVVTSVLAFDGGLRNEYAALADHVAPKEAEELASDLGAALEPMTAGVFDAFASVTFESASHRHTVSVARDRQIVVARFRGLRQSLDAVGYGGRTLRRDGSIASGTVMLDSEYDHTVGLRRLLRMHELGHALGYNHIASRRSIMNPTLGSDVTEFDRRAALVAFRRK
ncbi:MAG TPA: matrixin family metalloprotease [Vicinamibacterales bacterium]|nr:matrixin family metalloprotease [Vicinamibacterales bacterium]